MKYEKKIKMFVSSAAIFYFLILTDVFRCYIF